MFLCLSTDAFAQPSFSVWLLHRICFFDVLLIINGIYYLLCMKFSRYILHTFPVYILIVIKQSYHAGSFPFLHPIIVQSILVVPCTCFFKEFGGHLLSHRVAPAVSSAGYVLTVVFGMGTGVSPIRIATEMLCLFFYNFLLCSTSSR